MAVITGTPRAELLLGTLGDDTIIGGLGADTLRGGGGDDLIEWLDPDSIGGNAGDDVIYAEGGRTGVVDGHAGFDELRLTADGAADFSYAELRNVESFAFAGASAATATFSAEQFGDGFITSVRGSEAADTLVIRARQSLTDYDFSGLTFVDWDDGDVVQIDAGGYEQTVVGTSRADLIRGAAVADGGEGDDTIIGSGEVAFSGGAGDDWILLDNLSSYPGSVIDGGDGLDTLSVVRTGNLTGARVGSIELIRLEDDNSQIWATEDQLLREDGLGWIAIQAPASSGRPPRNQIVIGIEDGHADLSDLVLDGWEPYDVLVVFGGDGDDTLIGSRYTDQLIAGDGDDVIYWGGVTTASPSGHVVQGQRGDDLYILIASESTARPLGYLTDSAGTADALSVIASAGWGSVDFTGSEIEGLDQLRLDGRDNPTGIEARFLASQIGGGHLAIDALITGSGPRSREVLAVEADGRVGLGHLRFENWDEDGPRRDFVRVEGSDGADSIVGSVVDDLIMGGRGDDVIRGGAGDDTLYGAAGDDFLYGGLGDDRYTVTVAGDRVAEALDAGHDTVVAALDWRLSLNVEDLQLGEFAAAIRGVGNGLGNLIVGNSNANVLLGLGGDDTLAGGSGADSLAGGDGADLFVFDTPLVAGEVDRIVDFAPGADRIGLSSVIFDALATGPMTPSDFAAHIHYDAATGALSYDQDGPGGGPAQRIALLTRGLELGHQDFIIL